jgi:phosphatidylethanolamine/phosphatidyl-N-methylethanolamine N-methyltransferase
MRVRTASAEYEFSSSGPAHRADADMVRGAYARMASVYDLSFGPLLRHARAAAVASVNAAPGDKVLEVGVGTGLSLPLYHPAQRVTGIDLSSDMLAKARARAARLKLDHVEALLEMDAQATSFPNAAFDIAVAMFVASVVPDARALLAELRRIVKPGGTIIFINHFARDHGAIGWVERQFAAASGRIGWHADFRLRDMFTPADLAAATLRPIRPFGLFQQIEMTNEPAHFSP